MSLKELSARRSGYLGAVTKLVNNVRGYLLLPIEDNLEACERTVSKLLDTKAKFDDMNEEVIQHPRITKKVATNCEDSADRATRSVVSVLDDFERWSHSKMDRTTPGLEQGNGAPSKPQNNDIQTATLMMLDKLQSAVTNIGSESISNAVRAALAEQQRHHELETTALHGKIDSLTKELGKLSLLQHVSAGSSSEHELGDSDHRVFDQRYGPGGVARDSSQGGILHSTGRDSMPLGRPSFGRGRARGRSRPSSILYQQEPAVGGVADPQPMTWNFAEAASALRDMMSQSVLQNTSVVAGLQAPKVKLQQFDGNPLEFTRFMSSFDDLVHAAYDNDRSRLLVLIENCTGRAKAAIDGCMHLSAEVGYKEARAVLKRKFGADHLVTQAWIEKLLGYSAGLEGDTLEAFATDLEACRNSLQAVGALQELECTSTLQRIIFKLPRHIRHRWRKQIRMTRGEAISKADLLVQLVKEAAEDESDPAFSENVIARVKATYDTSGTPKSTRSTSAAARRPGVFAACDSGDDDDIEAELHAINKGSCAACRSGQHFTSRCRNYRELTPAGKLDFVRAKKLCLLCLAESHAVANCPLPWKCQDKNCGRRHHTSLHSAFDSLKPRGGDVGPSVTKERGPVMVGPQPPAAAEVHQMQEIEDKTGMFTSYETDEGSAYAVMCAGNLPIAKVTVRFGSKSVTTYALLDSGATITLCHRNVRDALGLPTLGRKRMAISTISGKSLVNSDVVAMHVSESGNRIALPLNGGMVVDHINISMNGLAKLDDIRKFKHLNGLRFNRGDEQFVGLLIGQNNAHLIDPKEVVRGGYYDPYAVGTPLGWVLYGNTKEDFARGDKLMPPHSGKPPVWNPSSFTGNEENEPPDDEDEGYANAADCWEQVMFDEMEPDPGYTSADGEEEQRKSCSFSGCVCGEDALMKVLQKLAELDHVPDADSLTKEERFVLDMWEREMTIEDGHIVIPIPFKTEPPDLINNFAAAYRALIHLGNQLLKDKEKHRQYKEAVMAYFDKGYAEVIWDAHPSLTKFVWYMLHHGVAHPRKPGVTRVVKHGSAKYKGYSLNTAAYPGPNLMNNLSEVLTRFRQFEVGATGDIEGMFNQVFVPERQRDYSRFLFWEDGDPTKRVIVCRMKTHIFGTIWAPAAANFALKKTAELYALNEPEIRDAVEKEFYVDDWCGSQQSSDETVTRFEGIRDVVAKGGFNLVKLASNSREVIKRVPSALRVKELAQINLSSDELPSGVLLGQLWHPESDTFSFNIAMEPRPYTRRGMTSCIASIFDPLGLIIPFILPAKLLLQSSSKTGDGWDAELLEGTSEQWAAWLKQLPEIENFRLRRWFGCDKTSRQYLHMFSDACERAYGAASYLAVKRGKTNVSTLVTSKSRVAPPTKLTIPKMEMAGAVLAVKLWQLIRKMFGVFITEYYFWVDSTIVLVLVLKDPDTLRTFMGNRVAYIQSVTEVRQWGHVAGTLNPADLSSRGSGIEALSNSALWLEGPEFLKESPESWERRKLQVLEPPDVSDEIKKEKPVICGMIYSTSQTDVTATEAECNAVKAELLPDGIFLRDRAEGNTANLILTRYQSWTKTVRFAVVIAKYISWLVKKIRFGSVDIDKNITVEEMNREEVNLLSWDQSLSLGQGIQKESCWKQLTPFWEGIWRVGGRCQYSELESDVIHPIILPRVSVATELLIRDAHVSCGHGGTERTVMELRGKFWVLGGKPTVKKYVDKCVICKRLKGRPEEQRMAPLPTERVAPRKPPFTHAGVDLFGPISVIVKRSVAKRYGAIFTCFNSRAVHLEPVEDLTASAFLDTIERFVMRRRKPETLKSDNGTNFIRSEKEISRAESLLADSGLASSLVNRRIRWTFNTPSASHQGGVWERLIRSARQIITLLMSEKSVNDSRFHTILCIAEGILNSRPLTRLTEDVQDFEPLTPGHFTSGGRITSVIGTRVSPDALRQDWKLTQDLASDFWDRWIALYLPILQKRTKWLEERENVEVGELVLIVNDQCARFEWPLGRVREVHRGRDGLVRNVTLRTGKGLLQRPVQKIVRLELDVP